MQIREHLVKVGTRRRKGNKLKSVRGVTIHNTGNTGKGAGADSHAKYQANTANEAVNGWHWTVDDVEAVLSIPENEIAEHAGKREGNDTTVGIEICENPECNLRQATDNAAILAAEILKRQGFKKAVWKENLFQHFDWSGKDCPSRIRRNQPYSWSEFVGKVNAYMSGTQAVKVEPVKPAAPKVEASFSRILQCPASGAYMRGDDVKAVQVKLIDLGLLAAGETAETRYKEADGIYGRKTEKAVHDFKVKYADGIVDALTFDKIMGGV